MSSGRERSTLSEPKPKCYVKIAFFMFNLLRLPSLTCTFEQRLYQLEAKTFFAFKTNSAKGERRTSVNFIQIGGVSTLVGRSTLTAISHRGFFVELY